MPQPKKAGYEDRFWLFWGEAPKGTPKYKAGLKALAFIRSTLEAERARVVGVIENTKKLTGNCICADDGMHYSCDMSYNKALSDAIKSIETKE